MTTPTTSSFTSNVALTGSTTIDALVEGVKWFSRDISYSIPTTGSVWSTSASMGYGSSSGAAEPWSTLYDVLTPGEAVRFEAALAQWSNVSGLRFYESSDNAVVVGDIRIAYSWMSSTDDSEAWAYEPHESPLGGDIWINTDSRSYHSTFAAGSYAFLTLMHEIGHTLGLKHPHETSSSNTAVLASSQDTIAYTLMSYFASPGKLDTYLSFYPTTPMLLDIQAIQSLYGKNSSYNLADTIYSYRDDNTYLETIWDAGGTNTLAYTGTKAATIDLREGSGSRMGIDVNVRNLSGANIDTVANVWIAYGTYIHNASSGTGNDVITGNELGNTLIGGGGNDRISGAGGNDRIVLSGTGTSTVDGGSGFDTLVVSGARSGYTISSNQTGHAISGMTTAFGSITESNVERVLFSDAAIAFDISGSGGKAYRLYQAAFDRTPDKQGLGYWIDKMDKGTSLVEAAAGFFNSAEFKTLYGNAPTNTDLINRFYLNVLHRTPDQDGFNYWMNELTNGHRSPPTALAQFSESPENQTQLLGAIQNGMEYFVA